MKTYSVVKIDQGDYGWIVIATSYISPILQLDDLAKDIENSSGHVLFDLTLINGTESNRYISADFSNGVFVKSSFRTVDYISESVSDISRRFFKDNPSIVDNGTISKSLKYLLKEGML